MKVNFPPAPTSYDNGYFTRAFATFALAINQSVQQFESVESILLQDSDGAVWKVTVDTSGNLQTTAVPLGQTGSPPY